MWNLSFRLQLGVVGWVLVGPKPIQTVSSSSRLMPETNQNFPVIITIKSALTMGGTHSQESAIALSLFFTTLML